MSKELEALEYLKENKRKHWLDDDKSTECLDTIETALKQLEQIKNSHLVAIPRQSGKSSLATEVMWYRHIAEEQEKVLQIIKEKRVNVNQFLKHCNPKNKWGYNKTICDKERQLTQEEYELLKEYFK